MMHDENYNEMMYQLSISVAKNMLKNGLVSIDDFNKMNCILLEKYRPFIGELFSQNDLII